MKISKHDALQWFEFFAQLDEDEPLMPRQQELALAVLAENGIALEADAPLTRAQVARTLYQISKMDTLAPGLQVLARQK